MDTAANRSFASERTEGLSSAEAHARLAKEGFNELPSPARRSTLNIVFGVAREPMFLLLIASVSIYLALGDLREALVLSLSLLVIFGITIFQEQKTERALEALRDLSSPRALVIRDGTEQRIAGREVVRGDLLILTEGDRVPADGVLFSCNDLMVDESLLTGESVPVRKMSWDGKQKAARPGGDDLPFVYSGTMVVQGRGMASVLSTGWRTEMGAIGKALESLEADETFLQKRSITMIRTFAIIGLALCAVVILLYGLSRGDWMSGLLAGIALAMSLLPEEIPVVLTVFLALGAWRMSQRRVLTRRMPAIEALGSATVLCVDKTGTLTLNRMSVNQMYAGGVFYDANGNGSRALPEKFHELVRFSILASETDPYDPMERALKDLGDRYQLAAMGNTKDWQLVHEYSLSPELLVLSHVWKPPDGHEHVIAAKGAPEAVADLCHFGADERERLLRQVDAMARDGLRVIGVAKARFVDGPWPSSQHDFDFEFIGLIGLADPIRPSVPAALKECHGAGINVVMITGDYPSTARAIARQAGFAVGDILTGPELEALSAGQLRSQMPQTNIFARVLPEQKLSLVEGFKANGEIVAMTGDGVNDAPALKAAHIGIAMGGRGTDVAREAAALVLLDDDFATIVEAIRSGRRIYDNLQKAMAFIFAIHVPIAGLALIPLILNWPLILSPVHIVFLELIIDPACSIAFEAEPEEANIMERPPRDPKAPLFAARDVLLSLMQGAIILFAVLIVLGISLYLGHGDNHARALTFAALIVGVVSLILVNRSWSRSIFGSLRVPNRAFWWVGGGALGFIGAALYLPALQSVFHFAPLQLLDLTIAITAGIVSLLLIDVFKAKRKKVSPTGGLAQSHSNFHCRLL